MPMGKTHPEARLGGAPKAGSDLRGGGSIDMNLFYFRSLTHEGQTQWRYRNTHFLRRSCSSS
jgi:hypothetical protein